MSYSIDSSVRRGEGAEPNGRSGALIRRRGWKGRARDGVECYYGIRYARLSMPDRPRARSEAASEQISVAALTDIPLFPQLPSRIEMVTGPAGRLNPQADDAFYLNVWAPGGAEARPVLVFIHGGAWASGGAARWYRGERLAADGVVVVTLNYRLGPSGHLEEQDDDRQEHRPFRDIVLALQWVKEHIAEFGGDPDRVTLAGQSAGAWYAWALSSLPEANGLFRRAALLSIPEIRPWTIDYRRRFTRRVFDLANRQREGTPSERLLRAGLAALGETPHIAGAIPPMYLPTLSEAQIALIGSAESAAAHQHIEALYIRVTCHEMSAFLPTEECGSTAEKATLEELRYRVNGDELPHGRAPNFWDPRYAEKVELASWLAFGRFSTRILDAVRRRGHQAVWRVFAAEAGPRLLGAVHCMDLPFQFGNFEDWADAPMLDGWDADAFEALSRETRSDLIDFVSGGSDVSAAVLGESTAPARPSI